MWAAGYIEVSATGKARLSAIGKGERQLRRDLYYPYTMAQCSVTVRDPKGTGSGWAGVSWNDWNRVDAAHLCAVALDKCLKSRNPVRIEPGRYTTILEPQAVFDLTKIIFRYCLSRQWAESKGGEREVTLSGPPREISPFAANKGHSKIGERVIDERLTVTMDPMDPDLGFPPSVYTPVTWIQDGVLKELSYSRDYAVRVLGQDTGGFPNHGAYKMTARGTPTSIEEMILTTRRGLLVTRFWGIPIHTPLDWTSLLTYGYTRDGVWLIENGKISKPVMNFRFTESPLFVLNNVEQIGIPQRVFNPDPECPAVVSALKVRDFSFTSLSDAV
jgi:predicted Zn-dependent protease